MNFSSGDIIPLWVNKDATANAPTAQIRRVSDGYYLDFSDDTFKASAWATPSVELTDGTTVWSYSWDSASLPTDEAACVIEYTVDGAVYCEDLALNFSGGGGGGATAQQIWEYATRTLTSGAAPSAATIAAAVWDEQRSSHATLGSFGEAIDAALTALNALPDSTDLRTESNRVITAMGAFNVFATRVDPSDLDVALVFDEGDYTDFIWFWGEPTVSWGEDTPLGIWNKAGGFVMDSGFVAAFNASAITFTCSTSDVSVNRTSPTANLRLRFVGAGVEDYANQTEFVITPGTIAGQIGLNGNTFKLFAPYADTPVIFSTGESTANLSGKALNDIEQEVDDALTAYDVAKVSDVGGGTGGGITLAQLQVAVENAIRRVLSFKDRMTFQRKK